ncbi:MAG: hypothetical protein BGO41_09420 [Clostridiales bacterium 38-18]|nr:MAG: hypothetical protein BGO41_09420 [Clostridiales bacterium 38-18]
MVPKKSIFERMGLIEHTQKEEEFGIEESNEAIDFDNVPEPDYVPDLTHMDLDVKEEKKIEITDATTEKLLEPQGKLNVDDIPKNISDKLDLIIGAYEKNKLMTIDEIYRNSHLESEVKKTIFMTDVYLKAIPENLPLDIKRETVLNIMNVSNISLDDLLNDAYKRIDSLNTVLEETVSTTQEVFNRNDATIRELEKRIEDIKEINKNRKKFQEDQNTMIEYEIQKIINLVEFVKPKK